jgi:hypothetical protein
MLNVIDVAIKVKPKHRAAPIRNSRKTKTKNASKQGPAPSVLTVFQTAFLCSNRFPNGVSM